MPTINTVLATVDKYYCADFRVFAIRRFHLIVITNKQTDRQTNRQGECNIHADRRIGVDNNNIMLQ